MKITREHKIGLVVLVSFVLIIWGMNYLKGWNIFRPGDRYYAVYSRVDGLTEASPIFFQGFKIGTVRKIDIHPTRKNSFLVEFTLTKNITLPQDSKAQIYSTDLMGGKGVEFISGESFVLVAPGDTLGASVIGDFVDQMSMQVLPLKDKTEKLIVKLDSALTQASAFLDDKTRMYVKSSLRDLSISMANMAEISVALNAEMKEGGSIRNGLVRIDSLTKTLEDNREKIASMINNLHAFSSEMKEANVAQTITSLNQSLSSVNLLLENIKDGKGTAGKIISSDELYNQIMGITKNTDQLLADIQANPKRYVHFSAIDLGRSSKSNYETSNQKVDFYIELDRTKQSLQLNSEGLQSGYKINEDFDGKEYIYTIAHTQNYEVLAPLLADVKEKWPNAKIVALKNGEPIRLEKVIDTTK